LDRIEKLCVEKNMRMTDQRRVVARVLSVATDHPDVESFQVLFAPVQAALADADTGCPIDRITLRNHALGKRRHC